MIGVIELLFLTAIAAAVAVTYGARLMPAVRARGALRAWADSDDGEVVGARARLKARREIDAFRDHHNRVGSGWAARASGLGISGATTLWLERRRAAGTTGFASGELEFDAMFFIGGDGGPDLDRVLRLPAFRAAVRELFTLVEPASVELDVDGNLTVRTGRTHSEPEETRALLQGTAAFADALTALAHDVKVRTRLLPAVGTSGSVGADSGMPMSIPAHRAY